MPCLALPCLALPCLALPCLALPCPALPCLALPCLALPCLALPCLGTGRMAHKEYTTESEGAVYAKSNRFGQPRANVMQKTDLTRQPLLALHVISESTIAFSHEFLTLSCANAHPNDHGEDSQGIGNPSIGKSENPTLNFCANASFLRSERSESADWGWGQIV